MPRATYQLMAQPEVKGQTLSTCLIPPQGQSAPWGMWKGEFWGKLMISACRVAEYAHDESLKQFLHAEALRLVALQRPDGYLGTYVNPDYVLPLGYDASSYTTTTKKAPWCWNLWCRKYTMWGLLANWQRVPNKINPRQNTPRHLLIKLTKIKHKEQY